MRYKHTTQVPNEIIEEYLPELTKTELTILLIIIRQTYGWRKEKDRISHSQFMSKAKLSKRSVIDAVQGLVSKGLVNITDHHGNVLNSPSARQGKYLLFYSYVNRVDDWSKSSPQPVRETAHNKTIVTKLNKQKEGFQKVLFLSDEERIINIRKQQAEERKNLDKRTYRSGDM